MNLHMLLILNVLKNNVSNDNNTGDPHKPNAVFFDNFLLGKKKTIKGSIVTYGRGKCEGFHLGRICIISNGSEKV